jgi:hypothetical protein
MAPSSQELEPPRNPGRFNIASRAHARDLKTLASWWELNGRSLKAVGEWLKEHWLVGAITAVLAVVGAGARAWPWVQSLFH